VIHAPIIHPHVLAALAAAGHRSTVLICDAHYAASTAIGPNATVVHLNITAGSPTIPDVLEPLLRTVAVEHAHKSNPPPMRCPARCKTASPRCCRSRSRR
jgi:L-fucose mutarotase